MNNVKKLDKKVIKKLSVSLLNEIEYNKQTSNYAKVDHVLKMVGAGIFASTLVAIPGLSRGIKTFINLNSSDPYKRFNGYNLKKHLSRLRDQKMIEYNQSGDNLEIKITDFGKIKILKYALDEVVLKKPVIWDKKWYLISYDIKHKYNAERKVLLDYLREWNFYKMHDSLYLHAYPCFDEVEYLRQYLQVGDMVKFFTVNDFEGSIFYKDYFGV